MFLLDYLENDCSLLVYDMWGTGNNKSKYVTLGLRESIDLKKIIIFLIEKNEYKKISLWGRSMGAVTIIHFLHHLDYHCLFKSENSKVSKGLEEEKTLKK